MHNASDALDTRDVLLGGLLPIAVLTVAFAMLLDDYLPPAVVWGGDLCSGPSGIAATCGVPPVGLFVALVAAVALYVPTVSIVARQCQEEVDDAE